MASNRNCPKLLTQHEVNLRILANDEKSKHSKIEYLNASGRYRSEDYEMYKTKRRQFYDSVKEYKDLNKYALKSNRFKSDIDGDISVKFEFLQKTEETLPDDYIPGTAIRKRTLREIHTFPIDDYVEDFPKISQPWFRRYWILSKFINAARKLIIKSRMLKRLEKLKSVTPAMIREFNLEGPKVININYPELFERFLQPKILDSDSVSTL